MIETWLLLFLIIWIRNIFIRNLQRHNVNIWHQYNIKLLFKDWPIYPPLVMLILYIIFETMIFLDKYWITQYSTLFKQITLLSYFGLVYKYQLYDSVFAKYKNKGLLGFLTSPFIFAITFLTIGYFLNYIAITANAGHMPVFPSNTYFTGYTDINSFTEDSFYILGDYTSKVIPLTDTIDFFYSNLSIGDIFVRGYVFVILYFSIKKLQNKKIIFTK